MDLVQKKEIINEILKNGFFSEYLPPEFTTEKLNNDIFTIGTKHRMIDPVTFSMDKLNDLNNRRVISIPEVFYFAQAVNALKQGDLLQKILQNNEKDEHSLSKIVDPKKRLSRFSGIYGGDGYSSKKEEEEVGGNDFMDNLKKKIELSRGCKCILHLDVANFYNSFYTHFITAILSGEEWANDQYQIAQKARSNPIEEKASPDYCALATLDEKICDMNLKRTHGLLMGPRLSFIIAEALMNQIDKELETELNKRKIDFVRYVDDYDVFIKRQEDIGFAKGVFNFVLNRYGFIINDSKTKIETFPFYTYTNFKDVYQEGAELTDIYAKYAQIEKSQDQNGALLYFCKNILPKYNNLPIALSLSFSLLKNVSKASVPSCNNISVFDPKIKEENHAKELLIELLQEFVEIQYDLEAIWVLRTIYKLYPDSIIAKETIEKMNEVALILYYYESKDESKGETLKEMARKKGWFLNYELFYSDVISQEEFKNNLGLSDITCYLKLKELDVNFYKKQNETSE